MAGHADPRPWLAVLCDAGAGLVLWVALSSAVLPDGSGPLRALVELRAWGLVSGALLVAAGLGLYWPHAAQPGPWRLRGLLAMALTVASSVAMAALQLRGQPPPGLVQALAVLACAGALSTTAVRAMRAGEPAGLLLPTRVALAMLAGGVLLFALIALAWRGPFQAVDPVPSLALLVLVAGALLVVRWQAQGGLWPWSRWQGRWLVLGLLAGLPVLLAALLYLQPGWARALWPMVATAVLAGLFVERLQAR